MRVWLALINCSDIYLYILMLKIIWWLGLKCVHKCPFWYFIIMFSCSGLVDNNSLFINVQNNSDQTKLEPVTCALDQPKTPLLWAAGSSKGSHLLPSQMHFIFPRSSHIQILKRAANPKCLGREWFFSISKLESWNTNSTRSETALAYAKPLASVPMLSWAVCCLHDLSTTQRTAESCCHQMGSSVELFEKQHSQSIWS